MAALRASRDRGRACSAMTRDMSIRPRKPSRRCRAWLYTPTDPGEFGDPYGTRTRVFAVRGRRPSPLDEGAMLSSEGAICGLAAPSQSVEFQPNETHDVDRVLPTVKWGQG